MTRLKVVSRAAAGLAGLVGLLALAGWALDVDLLKRVVPGHAAMKANTAVSFVLAGASLWLLVAYPKAHRVARLLGAAVAAIGLLTLGEYLFGWDLGIDQLLFRDSGTPAASFPGRVPPNTALGLVLLGLALFSSPGRRRLAVAQAFGLALALLALLALIGYAYGVEALYGISAHTQMALPSAVAFAVLAIGILAARPDGGPMAVVTSGSAGGLMIRRLTPAIILVPPLLGGLALAGLEAGLYDSHVALALLAVSCVVVLGGLVSVNAEWLRQLDARRRQAEESAARMAAIVESSEDAIIGKTLDGVITSWNPGAERTYGYTAAEVVGKPITILIPPDRPNELPGIVERLKRGERIDHFETVRVRKDGRHLDVSVTISPIRDADGNLIGASTIARDITERKRVEEALRQSEARSRAVLEGALDAIITIDERGVIESLNPAAERIFGYTASEVVGHNVSRLMPEPYASQHDAHIQRYLATGVPHIIGIGREVVGRRKDGSVFPIDLAVSEVHVGGRRLFTGFIRDITQRKQAEEALAAQTRELEQFAYVASHDLQEPLRMVASYVQLLSRRYRGKLDADADEFIDYAVDGAKRMQQLINDLLSYSRIGTRGKPFEPTDCEAVLEQALTNLQVAIAESGAVVTHDPLPTIMADPTHIGQLFQNLVGNAIKYHREGVPPRVRVSAADQGTEWLFLVEDNGIGIAPEFRDRIFLIFQRLHNRAEYSGTGIGLAICKKIVERHGGRIWVESEPGQGSTFYFTIGKRGGQGR